MHFLRETEYANENRVSESFSSLQSSTRQHNRAEEGFSRNSAEASIAKFLVFAIRDKSTKDITIERFLVETYSFVHKNRF